MSYPICRDLDGQKQFFEGVFCRRADHGDLSTGGDSQPSDGGDRFRQLLRGTGSRRRRWGRCSRPTMRARPARTRSRCSRTTIWKTELGGARDVVGREVLVNRHPLTIIGVAASAFHGIDVGEVPALWIPASMSEQAIPGFKNLLDRRTRWMQVLGRLDEGMTLEAGAGGAAAVVQGDAPGGHAPPGIPVITAQRRQRFLDSSLVLTRRRRAIPR